MMATVSCTCVIPRNKPLEGRQRTSSGVRLRRTTVFPAVRRTNLRGQSIAVTAAINLKPLSDNAATAAASLAGWHASRGLLETRLGLTAEEADYVISEAFGWGSQAYWRQQKVQHAPDVEQVEQVLNLLCSLGIAENELAKVVGSFPQVLGCELDLLGKNIEILKTKWFLKGRVLAGTVVRKPAVLGSMVDCDGSCIAECNRCWARF